MARIDIKTTNETKRNYSSHSTTWYRLSQEMRVQFESDKNVGRINQTVGFFIVEGNFYRKYVRLFDSWLYKGILKNALFKSKIFVN